MVISLFMTDKRRGKGGSQILELRFFLKPQMTKIDCIQIFLLGFRGSVQILTVKPEKILRSPTVDLNVLFLHLQTILTVHLQTLSLFFL